MEEITKGEEKDIIHISSHIHVYAIARKSSVPHPYSRASGHSGFTLSLKERRRDAAARDIQKGTHSSYKDTRKSNIQNEYGVAGTSRLALPRRNRVLFVADYHFFFFYYLI